MGKVTLMVFQKDCMGCHACEIACKQEHGLDVGPRFIKVIERGSSFVPIYCHHCARPPCKAACPEEAISRNEWGIVQVDRELCIGCKACIEACPFGAMQYDPKWEGALMCDLCYERLKKNQKPACSMACPTRCILWGDMTAITEEMERRLLQEEHAK